MDPNHSNTSQPSRSKTIIATGLLAGILDISGAIISFMIRTGKNPVVIFRFIASAVFGKLAYDGGWVMVVVGVLFHFIIAMSFTVLFFWLYPRLKFISAPIFVTGLVYGILVWVVMNLLVLPLTRIPFNGIKLNVWTFVGIFLLMVCIGVPVAYLAERFYKKTNSGGAAS